MDIVAAFSTHLKLEQNAASGLAGGVLLLIEDVVREKASFAAASCLRAAIPEMRDWQMASPTLSPGMLSLSTLPPAQDPTDQGDLIAVLGRFGVDGQSAGLVTSLMGQFLASRLDPANLAVVTATMPALNDRKFS